MALPPLSSGQDFRVWMQQVEDRLTRLEGRRSVTVGAWVLTVDAAGDVIARHPETGTVVTLAAVPVPPP